MCVWLSVSVRQVQVCVCPYYYYTFDQGTARGSPTLSSHARRPSHKPSDNLCNNRSITSSSRSSINNNQARENWTGANSCNNSDSHNNPNISNDPAGPIAPLDSKHTIEANEANECSDRHPIDFPHTSHLGHAALASTHPLGDAASYNPNTATVNNTSMFDLFGNRGRTFQNFSERPEPVHEVNLRSGWTSKAVETCYD